MRNLSAAPSVCLDVGTWPSAAFGVVVLLVAAATVALGQAPSDGATFEVASVKQFVFDPSHIESPRIDVGQVRLANYTLTGLAMIAYGVRVYQVVGPDWTRSQLYEVTAKPPDGARKEQISEMLQNLLAERFRMKTHWETREQAGYALVVGKSGPKLKKADDDEKSKNIISTAGHLEYRATTLDNFAALLTGCCFRERPVEDRTGVDGRFDIVLDVAKEDLRVLSVPAGRSSSADESDPAPTIFAAIRELGLELKSSKVKVKYLVIDSAEKVPTPN